MLTISATLICKKTVKETALVVVIVTVIHVIRAIAIVTVIPVIVIAIIIVIMIGNMEKRTKLWIISGVCGLVFLWIVFLFVPFIFSHTHEEKEIVTFLNVSFTAATALFTGIAFTIAYISLYQQNQNLNRQINLSVFSNTIRLIMDSDKFLQSRQYIYSKDYYRDIEELKRIIKNYNDSIGHDDLISVDEFGLKDFRKIIRNIDEIQPLVDKETKERLCISYEKIIYFCGRMEYLGFMCEKKAAVSLITDYYARTIMESYSILKPLIEKKGEEKNRVEIYSNYSRLFYRAKEKEEKTQP